MKYSNNKLARFSIRKYSIGVASVLIGFFFMGVSVSADQVTEASAVAPSSLVTEKSDAAVASTNTEIGKSTEVVHKFILICLISFHNYLFSNFI